MAITQVKAKINGQWYQLAYDAQSQSWKTELVLSEPSFKQPGGYFNVTVEAVNDTGAVQAVDGTKFASLQFEVTDSIAPTISFTVPSGYITTKTPTFQALVQDSGAGVDPNSFEILLNGKPFAGFAAEETADGYLLTIQPSALAEGTLVLTVKARDFSGNQAGANVTYIIDTVPPWLKAEEQNGLLLLDVPIVKVVGQTLDATSSPATVTISQNGAPPVALELDKNGRFSYEAEIEIGLNVFSVISKDAAGLFSTADVPVIRLITDRTQADVDALRTLLALPLEQWPEEQKEAYLSGVLRGMYSWADLNRVQLAVSYLRQKLEAFGEMTQPQQSTRQWTKLFHADPAAAEAYLTDVENLKKHLPESAAVPETPETLEGLWPETANAIEIILMAVDLEAAAIKRRQFWHSGESFSGE